VCRPAAVLETGQGSVFWPHPYALDALGELVTLC
jgi:hypothetical protein